MHKCQHSFSKILQIYELLVYDPSVSKKLPTLASPWLYVDIFFQNYAADIFLKHMNITTIHN